MSALCQFFPVIVLAAGSGGIPVPCKQDICLEGFINKTFYRLRVECAEVSADLTMDGDFLNRNVSFIPRTGCVTWTPGSLSHCTVTETDASGKKTNVPLTYNCTQDFDPSTTAAPTMSAGEKRSFNLSTTGAPTMRDDKKRHHIWTVVAAAVAVLLLLSVFYYMKTVRRLKNVKHKLPSLIRPEI